MWWCLWYLIGVVCTVADIMGMFAFVEVQHSNQLHVVWLAWKKHPQTNNDVPCQHDLNGGVLSTSVLDIYLFAGTFCHMQYFGVTMVNLAHIQWYNAVSWRRWTRLNVDMEILDDDKYIAFNSGMELRHGKLQTVWGNCKLSVNLKSLIDILCCYSYQSFHVNISLAGAIIVPSLVRMGVILWYKTCNNMLKHCLCV